MRAATIVDGHVEVLDQEDPVPGHGQVLIAMRGAALNGADLLQVAGFYPPPAGIRPDIPGMDVAGVVQATGPGATRFAVGDRVMGVVGGAAQAQLVAVGERELMPVPDGLDWPAAGGLPEVFTTAHDAVFTQAGLRMGERLLVTGAAGGVGTAAVQLGVATGATVTASVRNPDARPAVQALGATVTEPDAAHEHGPFDVILELVGGRDMDAHLDALAIGGRIAVIGVGGGGQAEIELRKLMAKRGTIRGSTLRARPPEAKADAARRVEAHVLPLVADGRVRVPIHAAFPLEDAAAAYAAFAAGGKMGKIVLVEAG